MKLVLPLPPQIGNERGHWAVRHRRKKAFYRACDERQGVGLIPAPPDVPIPHARLSAHLYLWNRMDHDNLGIRLKAALDWLVTRGYLTDDGPDYLTVDGVEQSVDRNSQRIEIDLARTQPERG